MRSVLVSLAALAVSGCIIGPDWSDEYRPIIDPQVSLYRGVNYEADLDVCQSYARRMHPHQEMPFMERQVIVQCLENRGYAVLPQTGWRGTQPVYR